MGKTSFVLALFLLPVAMLAADVQGTVETQQRQLTIYTGDVVLPQIADGDGWKTSIIFVNLSDSFADFNVFFYNGDGGPMFLPWVGIGTFSVLRVSIPINGSVIVETTGTSSFLAQGYAVMDTSQRIGGQAIFRRLVPGLPEAEAVVPFSSQLLRRYVLPFTHIAGFRTGVAIVNTATTNISITLTIRDQDGFIIQTTSITANFAGHGAFMFDDVYPLTRNRRGTIEFTSSGTFSILGLRGSPTGTLTTLFPLDSPLW